jgi:predicted transcriptional regulator
VNDTPTFNTELRPPGWISEQELARHLGVSQRHLINLRRGGLPYISLGKAIRYDLREVEQFIRTRRRLASHVLRQQRRKALEGVQ